MVMSQADALTLAETVLIPAWKKDFEAQKTYRAWAKGKHTLPYKPDETSDEYTALLEKSPVPLIGLVLKILTQALELKDYSPGVLPNKEALWLFWTVNRMPARQKRLYKAALTGGHAYGLLLPGSPVPVLSIYSAKNMVAVYQDPEADEWPMYGAYVENASANKRHFCIVDEEAVYRFEIGLDGENPTYIEHKNHDIGICPIVRFTADVDDEGEITGEVEPLIPIQASVDQSKFDLLMTQTFSSFKVRYASGMVQPKTQEEKDRVKLVLGQDRILISDNPETKFGTLDGTELSGYIEAGRASKQDLASVAQISSKSIIGAKSNESDGAEAQAAEEASTQRKLHDFRTSFGESISQIMRLAGALMGLDGAWDDYSGEPLWLNSEIQSIAQIADAFGKFATQLGIPKPALWEMIPNISPDTLARWKEMAERDPLSLLLADDSG